MKGLERKSVKRRIALLLSCVMLLMSALTGMAAEEPKGEWFQREEDGKWEYLVDGEPVVNQWVKDQNGEFYLGSDGLMCQDCWIDETIVEKNETRWYYVDGKGEKVKKQEITLGGVSYTFNEDGILTNPLEPQRKGWMNMKDGWYFYEDDGSMVVDAWKESNGFLYYLDEDGRMVTEDFVLDPNGDPLYFVDKEGKRVINNWGENTITGAWYYFGKDGRAVRNGWKEIEELSGTHRYHFDESGVLSVKKWISDEKGRCYLDENGFLVMDAVLPYDDGTKVYVDKDGYIDWSLNDEKIVGGITYNFKNGIVDTSVQPTVATPSNAESVDDLLATLEQMNKDGASSDTALKQEVADALLEGARDQAEDLDEETIVKLEDAILKAYGINIEKTVKASGSNADKDLEVTATGLLLASGSKPEDAKSKEIELQVEQATPSTAEKVVFDVKLLVGGKVTPLETPVYLSVKLPEVFASEYDPSKYTYKVTHTHGDEADTETADIKETEEGLILYLRAVSFSEFELTATLKNTSSGSSTGGGSSVSSSAATGKWVKAADGIRWWYQNPDGTWPAGGWAQLPWNGKTDWYYFDAEGYMVTGWITWEGNRYYLHPVADGTQGHMYTGWNEIGGQYYYFRPESGGPQGSLFVNGTTPDGYKVDANGVWIQ